MIRLSVTKKVEHNMSTELPDWYILKDPGDITVEVESWYNYANRRLERFLSEDLWIINKPTWMSENDWSETKIEEIGGHFLLRLAVAQDPRLTSWIVEVEGDLFEFRFVSSSNFEEKIYVLKNLYGSENVKTIQELNAIFRMDIYRDFHLSDIPYRTSRYARSRFGSRIRDLDKRIALKFHKIPSVIAAKKALLYQGWAIVRLADIRLAVKREFEKQLKLIIERTQTVIQDDPSIETTIKPIKEKITKIAKTTRFAGDFSKLGFEGREDVYTKPDIFPPCIQELLSYLQSKGHLSHVENWQLGTFLKRAGMSIDDQYRFWYQNSVDNVGMSYEEFVSRIGYQIRHIYGKEGGGIDYSPPSCKTCISVYYCYWGHKKLDEIREDIKIKFEDRKTEVVERTIDDISRLIINQKFQVACSRYFTFHTGWKIRGNRINHMLNYSSQAYRRFYSKKEKKEDE